MSPERDICSGNIGYSFYFSLTEWGGQLHDNAKTEALRSRLKEAYPSCCFEKEVEEKNCKPFQDLLLAQQFLHGDGLPFQCLRAWLSDYDLSLKGYDLPHSSVMLAFFPEISIVQVTVFLTFRGISTDSLVYLHHMGSNNVRFDVNETRQLSIRGIFDEVCSRLSLRCSDIETCYLLELKEFCGYDDPAQLELAESRRIYGILTGDEGWPYVPEALAKERLGSSWGSRNFVRFYAFGSNFVYFNLNKGPLAESYRSHQSSFGTRYYGSPNPYFFQDSDAAGVDHGILFSVETSMAIKALTSRIMNRHGRYQLEQSGKPRADIRMAKSYRRELTNTLSKVERVSMSELGELENVVLVNLQIFPIVDRLKYLLELLESELDLLYQDSMNRFINILTILGLLLTLINTAIAFM